MKVASKITKETMTNRHGDEFVFTLLEDGNIQWDGDFGFCRFSSLNHNTGIINMVDPSGGPYFAEGSVILGKTIKEFKSNKTGWLIITEKEDGI